jgi:hypothetical protein
LPLPIRRQAMPWMRQSTPAHMQTPISLESDRPVDERRNSDEERRRIPAWVTTDLSCRGPEGVSGRTVVELHNTVVSYDTDKAATRGAYCSSSRVERGGGWAR